MHAEPLPSADAMTSARMTGPMIRQSAAKPRQTPTVFNRVLERIKNNSVRALGPPRRRKTNARGRELPFIGACAWPAFEGGTDFKEQIRLVRLLHLEHVSQCKAEQEDEDRGK